MLALNVGGGIADRRQWSWKRAEPVANASTYFQQLLLFQLYDVKIWFTQLSKKFCTQLVAGLVQILWGFGEVLMEVSIWIDVYIQLMVDGWFGAQWFGTLGVTPSNNPFHEGIPGIETTGPQTTN